MVAGKLSFVALLGAVNVPVPRDSGVLQEDLYSGGTIGGYKRQRGMMRCAGRMVMRDVEENECDTWRGIGRS